MVVEKAAPLLAVEGLTVRFGGVTAVDELNFAVAEGDVHGLIGPNGAGKTTALNMISGLLPPSFVSWYGLTTALNSTCLPMSPWCSNQCCSPMTQT